MTSGRLAVALLCALTAFAGIGTAFAVTGDDDPGGTPSAIELRKDDALADVFVEEDDGDDDDTKGDDGTDGGDNTGDGDATGGDDGTAGGENTYVAPAPVSDGGYGDDSYGEDT